MVERGDYARNPDTMCDFIQSPFTSFQLPLENGQGWNPPDRPRRNIISRIERRMLDTSLMIDSLWKADYFHSN